MYNKSRATIVINTSKGRKRVEQSPISHCSRNTVIMIRWEHVKRVRIVSALNEDTEVNIREQEQCLHPRELFQKSQQFRSNVY